MPCSNPISGPLAIKYSSADTGQRPITTVDPNNPPWFNTHITLTDTMGATQGNPGFYNVHAGQQYTIEVTVTNISAPGSPAVEDVHVEVWASDFTAGGVGPASDIDQGGAALTKGIVSIPAGMSSVAGIPWTPTAADTQRNGGHICLAVNCYAGSSVVPTEGTSLSGNTAAFINVFCDSHHGQHNVTVVPVPAGGNRTQDLQFVVTNAHPNGETGAIVRVSPVPVRATLTASERNVLLGRRLVVGRPDLPLTRPLPGGPPVETARLHAAFASLASEPLHLAIPDPRRSAVAIHASQFRPVDYAIDLQGVGTGREVKATLTRGRPLPVTMHLALDPRATVGSVQSFNVTSSDSHGELIGGARIITVITD